MGNSIIATIPEHCCSNLLPLDKLGPDLMSLIRTLVMFFRKTHPFFIGVWLRVRVTDYNKRFDSILKSQ